MFPIQSRSDLLIGLSAITDNEGIEVITESPNLVYAKKPKRVSEVSIFPNLAATSVTILADEAIRSVEIYSITGSFVSDISISGEPNVLQVQCPLHEMATGSHLAKVQLDKGQIVVKRFVKH